MPDSPPIDPSDSPTGQPVLNYSDGDEYDPVAASRWFILAATFTDPFAADLAQAKLASEGLHSVLQGDIQPSVVGCISRPGIALMVPPKERDQALAVLAQTPATAQLDVPEAVPAAIVAAGIHCPACGSQHVARMPYSDWSQLWVALLLGLPLLFRKKYWRCHQCGREWAA